jgi:hypothetical protein
VSTQAVERVSVSVFLNSSDRDRLLELARTTRPISWAARHAAGTSAFDMPA